MAAGARACTLVIAEDAVANSRELIDELGRRYALRTLERPSGAFTRRRAVLLRELATFLALVIAPAAYRRGNLIVSGAGQYATLGVARLLAALGRDPHVFLFNFYIHGLGRRALVKRVISFLLTRRVTVAAQSEADAAYFASLSSDVELVLVPYGQGAVTGVDEADAQLGEYVFSGGYTNRDYDRLLRCARRLAETPFVIACSSLNRMNEPVPANVDIRRDLSPDEFHRLLARARLVVVPLAEDVGSAGQMVTLAAMQFGKAVVVADSPVVTQYVEDGATGLVYERTSDDSLCSAIASALADEQRLVRLGDAGRARYAGRFTKASYERGLLDALVTVAGP